MGLQGWTIDGGRERVPCVVGETDVTFELRATRSDSRQMAARWGAPSFWEAPSACFEVPRTRGGVARCSG